ncbi:MAG: outer membrane protein transport protein [Nitrosomonas sp.]|nr:outer membrane protein transport protein [Nitrosomonas sp.]
MAFRYHFFRYVSVSFVFTSICWTNTVMGAGFAIMEQSVMELGRAFSGAPTNTEDGSMVYFNPGAMSQVRGKLLTTAGYLVIPSAKFNDESSQLNPLVGGFPLRGNEGGNAANLIPIPNVYYVQQLTSKISFGLGVNSPFGMENHYRSDWKGRYQAVTSELVTVNINPSLAVKLTDKVSLGAGLNIQYLEAKLSNAVDFGTICLQAIGPGACINRGLLPQSADGLATLKGDSVGLGFNLGLYFEPSQTTRLGVSYRSRIEHEVKGTANYAVPDPALVLTRGGQFVDAHAQTRVTMPDQVILGFSQNLGTRWNLTGDALWTNWSLIRELRTDFVSPQADTVQQLNWEDTWRLGLGLSFTPEARKWTIRTGFAFDQTPVPSADFRPARIPDNDRYWLTAGFSYRVLSNVTLHGAYAHLFVPDPAINSKSATGDRLSGQYTGQVNIVGLQLDWRF